MSNATREAIEVKRRKAERYATEADRFRLESLSAAMESEHGDRLITFSHGKWSCSCEFFLSHETCSHVMALDILLSRRAGIRLSEDGQG